MSNVRPCWSQRAVLQSIIEAGKSAKPKHLGGSGENMVYITPEMYAALSSVVSKDLVSSEAARGAK
ncbi:hypothetical protein G3N95_29965 [Paraburkholderia sp. Tr-20389]|uniref:hypothetical protein n=1 Tax=Paraburkholderia sp. Tr-20389 TaxID=2703903 RepID=UPI00197D70DE|nr:hypothetical protein [Paraburkholderia sp. Tr-20389]MBN3757201.1 hypothetical protein [Paraburkholderia sp. Tr-20389]